VITVRRKILKIVTRFTRDTPSKTAYPVCVGDVDKGIEIVYMYFEGKNILDFFFGRLEPPRHNKNLLYQHDKPN
jgi:hypothetical protein